MKICAIKKLKIKKLEKGKKLKHYNLCQNFKKLKIKYKIRQISKNLCQNLHTKLLCSIPQHILLWPNIPNGIFGGIMDYNDNMGSIK